MDRRKYITPTTKVGLKLTAAERRLILDLMCLDDEFEEIVRGTPPGKPIQLTLDEWDLFGGFIAGEANHTPDKKLQRKLDATFNRIQNILDTYTDEEPELRVVQPVEDDSVEGLGAVDWALALAAKLHESRENAAGQPQVYRLNLTKPQRKALERTTLRKAIKKRLAAGEQALNLGLVEVMEIAFAISRAVKSASGREKRTLVNVASKVAEGLNSLLKMSHGGR